MNNAQVSLVLLREIERVTPSLPAGFIAATLRSPTDEHANRVAQSIESDGLPAGWTRRMLEQGHEAHVLLTDGNEFAGCGWIARKKYYISEIKRTFDPGAQGDYYFGDYVPPSFRGRKLHRPLIELRLAASETAGRKWAVGMTHAQNQPSVKGYLSAGFQLAMELRTKSRGKWRIDRSKRLLRMPAGMGFSNEGVPFPLIGRLRRV